MKSIVITELKGVFDKKISFDKVERMVHNHDVAVLPPPILKFLRTTPDAVIRIETVEDIQDVLKIARKNKIPITPRGRGTGGYGGAVPISKGLVMTFSWFKKVLNIDKEQKLVTVEPGIIWKDLELELEKHNLELTMYPTSAPGSSVGGFFAMGGSGIGSYKNGNFLQNVHSIEVIHLDGTTKNVTGDDLKFYYGLEGTTGIVSKITIKVEKKQEYKPIGIGVPTPEALQSILEKMAQENVPAWHVGFLTPNFARLKNLVVQEQSSEDSKHGTISENEKVPEIPENQYFMLLTVRSDNYMDAQKVLAPLIEKYNGITLDQTIANHEWEERYYPMRIKRLGPTLVPSEGISKTNRIADVLKKSEKALKGIAIEGIMTTPEEIVLLTFNLGDERSWGYSLSYSRSLKFIRILKKREGRSYGTGLYFTSEAANVFGKTFVKELKKFKTEVDPSNLLNPGKVLIPKARMLRLAMFTANFPVIRSFLSPMEFFARSLRGRRRAKYIPDDLVWEAFICAQCGYCQRVCTIFEGRKMEKSSPRGKFFYLRQLAKGKAKITDEMAAEFLLCTTCNRCEQPGVCQLDIPIQSIWDEMRGVLIENKQCATFPAFHMMAGGIVTGNNIWAHDPNHRDDWIPEDIKSHIGRKAELGYWSGCTASFVEPNIGSGAVRIMKAGGLDFTLLGENENCCGVPSLMAGLWDVWEDTMEKNIRAIHGQGIKKLVISCPGCFAAMAHYYPAFTEKMVKSKPELQKMWNEIELTHISKITDDLVSEGKINFTEEIDKTITWHDSCHLLRPSDYYENPRNVLKAIPGVDFREMEHNRENALCCGSVLTRIGNWDASNEIAKIKLNEAQDVGAEEIYATCPCCEFQMRVGADKNNIDMPIKDFTDIVLQGMGETPLADPTPNVLRIWNEVFEPAILLMTPDGLNKMMSVMMPEMMEAMPGLFKVMFKAMRVTRLSYLMSPMMGVMGKLPFIMPTMFKMMLPGMLPKMLPEIEEYMFLVIPGLNHYPQMKTRMSFVLAYTMEKLLPTMLPKMMPELKPMAVKAMQNHMKGKLEPIGVFRSRASPITG
ncbi:MAG: FAD-binding and (Fe-S)-binding domain-containing protein [Candidatus Hodarchaeales archaeon]|jgi:Fe-S oxidoreductase/FAD/FMN-containing dehydrogenase